MPKRDPNAMSEPFESYDSYPVHLIYSDRPHSFFSTIGTPVPFAKGQLIAAAGETPDCCYYIKKGRVISFEYTSSGEERIYNINDENSMLLETSVILNKPITLSFKAMVPSVLIRIPKDMVIGAITSDPQAAAELLFSVSEKFIQVNEQIRESACHGVKWKVANLLLTFANRYGVEYDGKILINEKLSQQMMANLLRVNRVTVARVIKDLRDLGLVEQINGYYCIRSLSMLQKHMKMMD